MVDQEQLKDFATRVLLDFRHVSNEGLIDALEGRTHITMEDLGFDSLDLMESIMDIESEFSIYFDEYDLQSKLGKLPWVLAEEFIPLLLTVSYGED